MMLLDRRSFKWDEQKRAGASWAALAVPQGLVALILRQHGEPLQPVRQLVVAAADHQGRVGEPAGVHAQKCQLTRVRPGLGSRAKACKGLPFST